MSPFTARDLSIYVGLPASGAVLGHLWLRFRRKLAQLTWTAQFQPFAFATEDFGWGKVQILYNGQPAQNLHVITVQITNDSQIDLANVEFNLQSTDGTMVLRSEAVVRGMPMPLPLAAGYAQILTEASRRQLTPPELAVWAKRSDWQAPVLNRGAVVDARLLVARNDHLTPGITVFCNHLGVRLRHQPPTQQFWGVNQPRASLIGLALGVVGVVALVAAEVSTGLTATASFVLGAFGVIIGAGAVRMWRWLARLAA
jgi:hypothetical protein